MKDIFKKNWFPYLMAVVVFLLLSIMYMNPVLSGKKLNQGDISQFRGMAKEIQDHRAQTGEEPLWTGAAFSGMPAYQISMKSPANLIKSIDHFFRLGLPRPADYLFVSLLGFFILLLALRVNPWLSLVGAIAYAFSSYFFIILDAGHNSKAHAIAYMAPVIAGFILTYRGKYLLGAIVTLLFASLEIATNHLQITYYLILTMVVLGIGELIHHIQNKTLIQFFKATGILLIVGILSIGPNITGILTTYEYSDYTIRGKSELTQEKSIESSGLDKDYATNWSYGKQETLSLMIPNIKGGGTQMIGNTDADLSDLDPQWRSTVAQQNAYWGNQPFTSGPVYIGAIVFFLFVLGMFIVKNHIKWPLFAISIIAIMLSWGHNMMWFTDFFFDYIPGYSKFRTVTMILVIAELCLPIIAILALAEIYKHKKIITEQKTAFYISLGLTAGVALILYLLPGSFLDFISKQEQLMFDQQSTEQPQFAAQIAMFSEQLKSVRIDIFQADVLRSVAFILLAAGVIYLYAINKIKHEYFLVIVAILILSDMWTIDKRYLNEDNFERSSKVENPFQMTSADKQILKDKDPNYRVFNLTVSPFNDGSTSFFHKSIGGYHGAKLRRYQELFDYHISQNNQSVLNMLNTKYIITRGNDNRPMAIPNPDAMGNAWFVEKYQIVENADEEIAALKNFDPKKTAFIDKRYENNFANLSLNADSTASIQLTSYAPNHLEYHSQSQTDQVAVFSEIYYPLGWKAYIDGQEASYFRTNYVLRGMIIPAGEHTITFSFEPASYKSGESIAMVSSILIILLVVGGLYLELKKLTVKKEEK